MDEKVTMNYGKCRFCYKKGSHRDIMKEYHWNGVREVYYDLFQECFNLYLSTSMTTSSLICSSCVVRLREANTFRMLVVGAERQLTDVLEQRSLFVSMSEQPSEPQIDVKVEVKDESRNEVSDDCDLAADDEDYDSDALPLDRVSAEAAEARLLARFPPGALPALPTRGTLHKVCEQFARHLDSLKGKTIKARSLQKLTESSRIGTKMYVTEKIAHVVNVSTILEHSNVSAFRSKTRSGFPCFYCRKICENFDELQDHQETGRCRTDIRKLLMKASADCLVVYVHVKNLACTICNQSVQHLNDLKIHLTRTHDKKMHLGFGDRVIPFKQSKTNEFECQVCGFNFETFGSVERHMNVHYSNYVCDQCGAGYITKHRLKVHIKYAHEYGKYPCELCKKVYATQHKYKSHVDAVHKMVKKNKCPKCPERFADYFNRHKHMEVAHGIAPLQYKCNVCDSVFRRRYALSCHMKRRHLEVRDVQCPLCSYRCYTNTELKTHMIKHNGERTYECTVCKKSYARKKTLKEHMRIHNNDRRYACSVCGQAFVQNCSLKGHMKTHHTDFVNGLH